MTTKRIVTGAHYGTRDWLAQRITGVIIAVYAVIMLIAVFRLPELSYGTWSGLFVSPFMKVVTMLAVLSLIYHAWVGIRDVIMDYITPQNFPRFPAFLRLMLEVGTILLLIGYATWAAVILWRV